MRKRTVVLVMLCTILTGAQGQLVVNNTLTPEQLVQDVLLGGGVTVSNVTFNGASGTILNDQIGSFIGTASNIGIDSGLVLASGSIQVAVGPNDSESETLGPTAPSFTPDPDLEMIFSPTNDGAVLEFDFIPAGDSIVFDFVFGSEEYNEYVCSGFNDVFGFFLSGPGISGPYSGNAANIALIPGTNVPIAINTVNNGTVGAFGIEANCIAADPNWTNNSIYYFDNFGGTSVEFDGFTVVLTASALVQCGQTYHIKIAIADAGDSAFDSGVFIEGGSFSSPNAIDLEVVTASADGSLTEGCTDAVFIITRPNSDDSLDVTVVVSGTATNGTDFTSIPPVITIPADSSSVSIPISSFEDGIPEGVETIILTATYINACGDTSVSSVTVPINEYVPILLSTQDLQLECPEEDVPVIAEASGGFGDLSFSWSTGATGTTIMVPGNENGVYTVTVADECDKVVSADVIVDSGCEIIIPNVFSPNNDGENDTFWIEGILGTTNSVKIFNRWGQIVFEANNYRNNWDGRDVSDGTYFYEVIVAGEPEAFVGHLTILNTGN